jgi:hypothetical protein
MCIIFPLSLYLLVEIALVIDIKERPTNRADEELGKESRTNINKDFHSTFSTLEVSETCNVAFASISRSHLLSYQPYRSPH